MKKLKLPKSLIATVAAPALFSLVAPAGQVMAQGQTETKIRLMADALRARDSGDLDTAKKNLEELLALAPNDATVQRLLAGVNASIAARASGVPASAEVAASATPSEPVAVTFPSRATSSQATASAPDISEAELLTRQENERINGLVSAARARRGEARALAKNGQFDEATAVLDGAINSLPATPATQATISDLQAEKNGLLLEKAQYALKQGDTEGARASLEAYSRVSVETKQSEKVARSIDKVELNPPLQPIEQVNPRFVADQKAVAQLVAKGRSQYLAGDLDGAQETFRSIELIDAGNPEVKAFLTRIANEKAKISELNRIKTRAQLVQEVSDAWNRPGIYVDRTETRADPRVASALDQKLNSIVIPSVNFNGVELNRVISTLSAISVEYDRSENPTGVNLVMVDPGNKNPPITITLRNLSLKRILDLITDSAGYTYEVEADIVSVRPSAESGPGLGLDNAFFPVTRAMVLRMTGMGASASTPAASADPFAAPVAAPAGGSAGGESDAIRNFLEQAGVRFSTTPGSSLVYDGAAIIVNQTSRNIERIRNILNRYNDVRQVEIESKFMDVQEGSLEELGMNWNVSQNNRANRTGTSWNRSLTSAFSPSAAATQGVIQQSASLLGFTTDVSGNLVPVYDGTGSTTPIINNAPQVPGAATLGDNMGDMFEISAVLGSFDVTATIRALSQKSGTDLLSSPKVTVLSGNPANIVIAQELRYPQSYGETQSTVSSSNTGGSAISITAGTPQEFTTRNVGVELKVTPTVEEDDYSISLDLNPKVTEFEGFIEYGGQSVAIGGSTTVTVPSGFYQPIFSTREVTTKVTVWDGATLVMGGLTREEVRKVSDKVPVLGDIPLIGRAFRSKGEASSKRNLLIFVTANLVTPGGSPKKQALKYTQPASVFQNPTVVTPSGAEPRSRQ